jgi:hypothetical protein
MPFRDLIGRSLWALPAWGLATACAAQAPGPTTSITSAAPLPYQTVAEALAGLKARDGDGTIVTHSDDGWVIINEPLASAQWSFTPPGHAAYPAVVRRIVKRGPNRAPSVDTASLCEAPAPACAELMQTFAALNERITQAKRASERQAPVGQ